MTELPDKTAIADWIRENPDASGKREIARAFGLKGAQRAELKRLLRELEDVGEIERKPRRAYGTPGHLPPVAVLIAGEPDANGDLFAEPQGWDREEPAPKVLILPSPKGPAPGKGDRLLTRVNPVHGEEHQYDGKVIRIIGSGPKRMLGIFRAAPDGGGRLVPVAKGDQREWIVSPRDAGDAENGELVEAEQTGRDQTRRSLALPRARITERLGAPGQAKSFSLIAIHEQGIPDAFPEEVMEAAASAQPVTSLKGREDLRHLPLVTIDPADARDHDDAVCAMPDEDPENPGRACGLGRHSRRRPLRAAGFGAGPGGAAAREFDLLPRPRGADAARGAVGGPLLAGGGRGPALHRAADGAGRGRGEAGAWVPSGDHALAGVVDL